MFMILTFLTSYLNNAQFRGEKNQSGLKIFRLPGNNFIPGVRDLIGRGFARYPVGSEIFRDRKREEEKSPCRPHR
jgi:hypothetical protein